MTDIVEPKQKEWRHDTMGALPDEPVHPAERPMRRFVLANRAALGTLGVFAVMMAIFIVANPRVFSNWGLYASVLTTLPVAIGSTGHAGMTAAGDMETPLALAEAAWRHQRGKFHPALCVGAQCPRYQP